MLHHGALRPLCGWLAHLVLAYHTCNGPCCWVALLQVGDYGRLKNQLLSQEELQVSFLRCQGFHGLCCETICLHRVDEVLAGWHLVNSVAQGLHGFDSLSAKQAVALYSHASLWRYPV